MSHEDLRSKWMKKTQEGDTESYGALLNSIGPAIFRVVCRRFYRSEEREEVYQEVLINLHRARHTYDPMRAFDPWLNSILRNTMIDWWRKNSSKKNWVSLEEAPPLLTEEKDSSLEQLLEKGLKQLSPKDESLIRQLKLEGLSLEEVALRLDISLSAAKVRAHRAYQKLKRILLENVDLEGL